MDDAHKRKIAVNEDRFRQMNEGMTAAVDEFRGAAGAGDDYTAMCECALTDCSKSIAVSRDEYAHVRTNDRWFIVVPDHVVAEVEHVVERHDDRFWIVEKTGVSGALAEELA